MLTKSDLLKYGGDDMKNLIGLTIVALLFLTSFAIANEKIDAMCNKEFMIAPGSSEKNITRIRQQDKKKHKYNPELHITYDELIQKLYDCDLRCYYCKTDLCILYTHKKSADAMVFRTFQQ